MNEYIGIYPYIPIYIYMHTYIHAYIHTYIHTSIHSTYIHTYRIYPYIYIHSPCFGNKQPLNHQHQRPQCRADFDSLVSTLSLSLSLPLSLSLSLSQTHTGPVLTPSLDGKHNYSHHARITVSCVDVGKEPAKDALVARRDPLHAQRCDDAHEMQRSGGTSKPASSGAARG